MAACLAIDPDDPAERQYLDRLSKALNLPGALTAHLDAKAEAARLALSTVR